MGGMFVKQRPKSLAAQAASKVTEQDKVVLVSSLQQNSSLRFFLNLFNSSLLTAIETTRRQIDSISKTVERSTR